MVATQREDLWDTRDCQAVVDRLQGEGVWTALEITGPAPYLPEGYGGRRRSTATTCPRASADPPRLRHFRRRPAAP